MAADEGAAARPPRRTVIDRKRLLRALDRRDIADWVLVQRDQEIGIASDEPALHRTERRVTWHVTVHHDAPQGRGSAHVMIDATNGIAEDIVEQALALARSSIGPAWSSSPPAAPAHVAIADKKLAGRDVVEIATSVAHGIAKPADASVVTTARMLRELVNVASRAGLKREWPATALRVDALVRTSALSLSITREARQLADLDLDDAVRTAADNLVLLAAAGAPVAGPCGLVLRPEAMLHGGLGVWQTFVPQADAVVERQGLTRYRERAPIAPGSQQVREPLTISSDGAIDYGIQSAPLGDEGDAVRAFSIVDEGIAVGLGLGPREAALRKRDPNGGVRNLVVRPGSWNGTVDASAGRVIEILRLRSMTIDPYTGDASLEIALGIDHPNRTAFAGGSIHIDLIAALARARRSSTQLSRGAYRGPDAVWLDRADLIV
ncbi:MAG TPA: metallopeptidase TldD-related protein [Kofleriaceae bacterium]|nr:metallopeptidase TldD-related protein [Kofleriaceae bacterium]